MAKAKNTNKPPLGKSSNGGYVKAKRSIAGVGYAVPKGAIAWIESDLRDKMHENGEVDKMEDDNEEVENASFIHTQVHVHVKAKTPGVELPGGLLKNKRKSKSKSKSKAKKK